jgi:hypothetical protein
LPKRGIAPLMASTSHRRPALWSSNIEAAHQEFCRVFGCARSDRFEALATATASRRSSYAPGVSVDGFADRQPGGRTPEKATFMISFSQTIA